MKTNFLYKTSLLVVLVGLSISSCAPKLNEPVTAPSKGNADFTKYVAVGNSLTAGFADNGLYVEGQQNSYPEMLAMQFKVVGGGNFMTPFFTDAEKSGLGYLTLNGFDAKGNPSIGFQTSNLAATSPSNLKGLITFISGGPVSPTNPNYYKTIKFTNGFANQSNNLGIPGIRLSDIISKSYAIDDYNPARPDSALYYINDYNPFYDRLLPTGFKNTPYLAFAASTKPTFFSSWLGNNDILQFAGSGGGAGLGGQILITPIDKFPLLYGLLINTMTANGAKGVVASIPDVTDVPFFTTVTINSIQAAVGKPVQIYVMTGNADGTNGVPRVIDVSDYILLTAQPNIGKPDGSGFPHGFHPLNPLKNSEVLDKDEATVVKSTIQAYNQAILAIGQSKSLAFMDANALLKSFKQPQPFNGATYSSAFISGNLFSLDGVHLTPAGYAIVANEYIKAINTTYQSNIPFVSVSQYRGVKFP